MQRHPLIARGTLKGTTEVALIARRRERALDYQEPEMTGIGTC